MDAAPSRKEEEEKARRPQVLLLEDDDVARELLAVALEDAGMVVATAGSCADAARVAEETRPDLFVLDRHLPDGDGWSALSALKLAGSAAEAPAIALTGRRDARNARHALRAGCDAYLEKPVLPEIVVDVAQKLLLLRQPTTSIRARTLPKP